ncbi:hypothetical protein O6P43_002725 [Quillaja saponaria]|uniref:Uncharacterized protein n=1 Tax=Quillaja saponaria TaxID=32244 RepID=A0AAD7VKN5_QUISA|nr:hypothetical protein O6P43_002725 [Quillaja saponaria]
MNHLVTCVLDPLETLSQRPFHLALHVIPATLILGPKPSKPTSQFLSITPKSESIGTSKTKSLSSINCYCSRKEDAQVNEIQEDFDFHSWDGPESKMSAAASWRPNSPVTSVSQLRWWVNNNWIPRKKSES